MEELEVINKLKAARIVCSFMTAIGIGILGFNLIKGVSAFAMMLGCALILASCRLLSEYDLPMGTKASKGSLVLMAMFVMILFVR